MTTGIVFQFGNEVIEIRIDGLNLFFRTNQFGGALVPFKEQYIKLSKSGVLKEFPDLKENENWKGEAIKRFKERLKEYKTEEERVNYIIDDLSKFGYVAIAKQRLGHRVIKLNKK